MNVNEYFYLTISDDQLSAKIDITDAYKTLDHPVDEVSFIRYLSDHNITYGLQREAITSITSSLSIDKFPLIIAKGTQAIDGNDGDITYTFNNCTKVERSQHWNFRDVMRIPTVKQGDQLAEITLPTEGRTGKNIYGKPIPARKGKKIKPLAGNNVKFVEDTLSYYAMMDGQVSVTDARIEVNEVYEIHEDLSMKTGNIDFIGSVIIHGDVPTGYQVNAGADIKVYGLVEAANIVAGGSVYISEGFAGMQKGRIEAEEDIHIGYINQGNVIAKNNVFVEHSILHSSSRAGGSIFCKKGNIIGGHLTVGNSIEAKDIGNRLNTETRIKFHENETLQKQEALEQDREELQHTLDQLTLIGDKLKRESVQDAKQRITLLRQRNSQQKVLNQLKEIDLKLSKLEESFDQQQQPELKVRNVLYPNVTIAFGKYKYRLDKEHFGVKISLVDKEVSIVSIESGS